MPFQSNFVGFMKQKCKFCLAYGPQKVGDIQLNLKQKIKKMKESTDFIKLKTLNYDCLYYQVEHSM